MSAKAPARGVALPANAKGERSSTSFGKGVLGHAVAAADAALSSDIAREPDWRHKYGELFVRACEAGASRAAALDIAARGLAKAYELAEFVRGEEAVPLGEATARFPAAASEASFSVGAVRGEGAVSGELEIPYRGERLVGARCAAQFDAWAAAGQMEPSCAEAAKAAVGNPAWLDLRGCQFVLLGAGSELGPLEPLLRAGATVLAIGTRRPDRWQRLIALARASAGELVFPTAPGTPAGVSDEDLAAAAGCDLGADLPEVLEWILRTTSERDPSGERPLTLGTYIYADGEANVRITLASDVIIQAVAAAAPRTTFAWLGSFAGALVLPEEAYAGSQALLANAPFWQRMLRFEPNNSRPPVGDPPIRVHNGYVTLQGPNYALAQQLRVWRASVLLGQGRRISLNMAPACRTASVLKSSQIKAGLDGAPYFEPIEIYDADTAKAVMFALLVADVRREAAAPEGHPGAEISAQAFHGGMWRCPFRQESFGAVSFVLGKLRPIN